MAQPIDEVLAAQKHLNDVKAMTNDKDQIAKAKADLDAARSRFATLSALARKK